MAPYRRFRYVAGTDSIDLLYLLSFPASFVSFPRDGNLRGNMSRARKRQNYRELRTGGGTQLYSVGWNGNDFISPFVRKAAPYQTFIPHLLQQESYFCTFPIAALHNFISFLMFPLFLSAFFCWHGYWSYEALRNISNYKREVPPGTWPFYLLYI